MYFKKTCFGGAEPHTRAGSLSAWFPEAVESVPRTQGNMVEVNPIKETLLLGVLNVGLPTVDVYSDIGLTYKLYTTTVRSYDWRSKSWTTNTGHPI